jgi:hypothetical protein
VGTLDLDEVKVDILVLQVGHGKDRIHLCMFESDGYGVPE